MSGRTDNGGMPQLSTCVALVRSYVLQAFTASDVPDWSSFSTVHTPAGMARPSKTPGWQMFPKCWVQQTRVTNCLEN